MESPRLDPNINDLNLSENFSDNDVQRRNKITKLLSDWGLVEIVNETLIEDASSISQIKIIPYKEKGDWELVPKYSIGSKKTNG